MRPCRRRRSAGNYLHPIAVAQHTARQSSFRPTKIRVAHRFSRPSCVKSQLRITVWRVKYRPRRVRLLVFQLKLATRRLRSLSCRVRLGKSQSRFGAGHVQSGKRRTTLSALRLRFGDRYLIFVRNDKAGTIQSRVGQASCLSPPAGARWLLWSRQGVGCRTTHLAARGDRRAEWSSARRDSLLWACWDGLSALSFSRPRQSPVNGNSQSEPKSATISRL